MNVLESLFLVLSIAAFANGQENDARIVGGVAASPAQYPYQVSLQDSKGNHYCGGAIINDRWILTAAHCIKALVPTYVMVGSINLNSSTATKYLVQITHYHDQHNPDTKLNDIAMVKTKSQIAFNANVQPINLAGDELPDGTVLSATGWGALSWPSISMPNILQVLKTPKYNTTLCVQAWGKLTAKIKVGSTQICVFKKKGQGTCKADSGGPLMYQSKLYGITSFGLPCALGSPDVFTKVSSHLPWIAVTQLRFLIS